MNQSKRLEELHRECCLTGRAYRNAVAKVGKHILRKMKPWSYESGYSGLRLAVLRKPFRIYNGGGFGPNGSDEHTHISECGFIDACGGGCGILGWEHYGQRILIRLARHVEQHGFQTPEERKKAA
jgi:hypothetical protein